MKLAILKADGIDALDYMIATHPDEDHIGGLSAVLNYATVSTCYSPVAEFDSDVFASLIKYLDTKSGIAITVPESETSFELGSAKVQLFRPIEASDDTNNMSIVTRITYGDNSFLFMGDAEFEEEAALIDSGVDLSCDVIKVGHHGSKYSTGEELLKAAKPRHAVISVDADNAYEHPTKETLERLNAAKVFMHRTDMQGDIKCFSDGKKIFFRTENMASKEALWIPGPAKKSTIKKDGVVVPIPPEGEDTFVINLNNRRFHLMSCENVANIPDGSRKEVTTTAAALVEQKYIPCGNCKPYQAEEEVAKDDSGDEKRSGGNNSAGDNPGGNSGNGAAANDDQPSSDAVVDNGQAVTSHWVLNTNTGKIHYPSCKYVKTIKEKNYSEIDATLEELYAQGYTSCEWCLKHH